MLMAGMSGAAPLVGNGDGQVQLPPEVLLVPSAPHDWLLPRCCAVVHHAGVGEGATRGAGVGCTLKQREGCSVHVHACLSVSWPWHEHCHAVHKLSSQLSSVWLKEQARVPLLTSALLTCPPPSASGCLQAPAQRRYALASPVCPAP